jgi:hypothetical protein
MTFPPERSMLVDDDKSVDGDAAGWKLVSQPQGKSRPHLPEVLVEPIRHYSAHDAGTKGLMQV